MVSKGFILHLIRELGLTFTIGAGGSLRSPCLRSEVSETFKAARAWAEKRSRRARPESRGGTGLELGLATHLPAPAPTISDGMNGSPSASLSTPQTTHLQNGDAHHYCTRPARVNQLETLSHTCFPSAIQCHSACCLQQESKETGSGKTDFKAT